MDRILNKRRAGRVIWTFLLAAALALIPPVLYQAPLYNVFFLEDAAKEIASQFSDATRWIHAGAIAALWLLNLIFFIVNESKGDSGSKLSARTGLQRTLNILFVILGVAAIIGYRYSLSSEVWIGVYLPSSTNSKLTLWMPYFAVAFSAIVLAFFCMCSAPATNCAVRCPIAKWFDNRIKRAERTR